MPSPLSGIGVHHPPVQVFSPLLFSIASRPDSRLPSSSCHGAAFGCCRAAELAPPAQRLALNKKGPRSGEARLVLARSQQRRRTNAPKHFIQGRRQFSPFPFPFSLGSHPPPHRDFGTGHQQTFNSVQDCLSSQEAGWGGWASLGRGLESQPSTELGVRQRQSRRRSSGHCSTPGLPCFMFPQAPPHARGARATEPAPLMCIRRGSRHHVHDITCSGTGSGTFGLGDLGHDVKP